MLRENTIRQRILNSNVELRVELFAEDDDEPIFENVTFGEDFNTVTDVIEFVQSGVDDFCDSLYESTKDAGSLRVRNRKGH